MSPAELQADYAARIAAAAAQAQTQRDTAFVAAPHDVCGLRLRAMTLRDYLHLTSAGCAHLVPGPAPEDPAALARHWAAHHGLLLWVVWEESRLGDRAARDAFLRDRVAPLDFGTLSSAIGRYLGEMFHDAPRAPRDPAARAHLAQRNDPLRVSFVAHHVHRLAAAYGWPLPAILDLPLPVLFQLDRLIRAEERIQAKLAPEPFFDDSDRLWAELLDRLNEPASPA